MVQKGPGRDIWNLTSYRVTKVLLYFSIDEYLYAFLVVLVARSFQIQCYVWVGNILTLAVGSWVSTLLSCRPILYTWEQWDGEHQGTYKKNINR